MAAIIRKIFHPKKNIPLACAVSLENEPGHLFQSQSCASCPPTTAKILEATMNPNLLLLSYDVTYFNHMGWDDTFGDSRWDKRQQAYLRKRARTTKFTPQVIADGVADGTGAESGAVDDMVNAARGMRSGMSWHIIVDTNDTELRIDSDGMDVGLFDIYLVNYNPKTQVVKISHRNLVKDVIKIGEWNGGNLTIDLPDMSSMAETGLDTVAFIQGANCGPIVASQKL
ncbi:thioredoxin-like protein [Leptodontidium sp. MPI-SDFR-AT-0119]|nr:thioredoxin-like protein [Leptodontidium sp. MPI-SDFR-AT-0119]